MRDIPTIRVQLDGVRRTIQHCFADSDSELSKMVQNTIEKTITEEWVQYEINKEVRLCLDKAIASLSNNYTIQKMLEKLISESIQAILDKDDCKGVE